MSSKAVTKATIFRNWKEFEDGLKEIAFIDAHIASQDASRRLKLIDIEAEYNAATEGKATQRIFLANELEKFYLAHRKEVEATGKKSREFAFGRAGMKTGNKILKLIKGWNWKAVCETMSNSLLFQDMVISRPQIDKNAVKKLEATPEQLAEVGVKIVQPGEFFFETYPEKAVNAA